MGIIIIIVVTAAARSPSRRAQRHRRRVRRLRRDERGAVSADLVIATPLLCIFSLKVADAIIQSSR